jgi:DNA-binding CsgD family transcriptional regulator
MREPSREPGIGVVGREAELALLREFLDDRSQRAVVLTGGPGIGKTTLWQAAVEAARQDGRRVLTARPSEADAQLSFAALIDLLDGIALEELEGLPEPQLRALEVALLRAEPDKGRTEPHAFAVACLNALRILAAHDQLLVAVDDLQWLDPQSAEALVYTARRLQGSEIGFLVARRSGRPSTLEAALKEQGLGHVDVLPLSLGAIRRLLLERLGLSLPRHLLRRIVDVTIGNPLFALEVGRTLAEDGLPGIGEELPLPDAVEDLLGTRVARLPKQVRRLLLAIALSGDLRPGELAELAEAEALDDGLDAGVLAVEDGRIRASHPLFAAAARKHSRARERRELHLELARIVTDRQLRARHLALATAKPDEEVAALVSSAAAGASARAARQEAVDLAEHALRLTPAVSGEWNLRLLALAQYLVHAGEPQRATDLLRPEVESLPAGAVRAQALMVLADGAITSNDEIVSYFDRALEESRDEPGLHASVLARMSTNTVFTLVARMAEAESWALQALEEARRAEADERTALYALAWARSMRGQPIDDVCERFAALSDADYPVTQFPDRVRAQRHFWRGEVDPARAILARLLPVADQRGEPYSYALLRLHLCQLEQRSGNWTAATQVLDEWAADREVLAWPMYERSRALLAAGRGLPDEAERWATQTLARAEATGTHWDRLEALRARGGAALLAHDPARAAASLGAVWEHARREGVDELGVFPVAPDLVEALLEVGKTDEATAVVARLEERSRAQDHPWGLATAQRCRALALLAGAGYDDEAATALAEAATAYGSLGLRFDRARSFLSLGRVQRRSRKWAAARTSLEDAVAEFGEIGSPGWAEEARSELERVGGRRPRGEGALTPAEQRVADLAAQGLSNKEIAQALFITVNTVEVHLSHAYAKLGVRSRSQLARVHAVAQRSQS